MNFIFFTEFKIKTYFISKMLNSYSGIDR